MDCTYNLPFGPIDVFVGLLTSIKDMFASALVYQLILPLALLVGAGIIYFGQLDLTVTL